MRILLSKFFQTSKCTAFVAALLALFWVGCTDTVSVTKPLALPQARRAVGVAPAYVATPLTDADGARLKGSILERRALAWSIVAKALAPVATQAGARELPAWATWYAKDDFQRMFHKVYDDMGKDERKARMPISSEALNGVETWNAQMVTTLAGWTEERYQTWVGGVNSDERAHNLTGMSRTLFSPAVVQHVLGNYKSVNDCLDTVSAVPFADAGKSADNFSLCFDSEFPASAAVAKTAWVREGLGIHVKTYDTDAVALGQRLHPADGSWDVADRESDPDNESIYKLALDGGARFRLAGLHFMTKELREWIWITLWWSDKPDEDFGEDRPDAIRALGGPWSHYKMCVVVGFDEEGVVDDDLRMRYPGLAASLSAAQDAVGSSSWCSNPYFETGAHNHRSNCIGCHQHAGSAFEAEDVLNDEARFPAEGRRRVRENFPSDYLWSFSKDPERWAGYVRNQITHYDVYDPLNGG